MSTPAARPAPQEAVLRQAANLGRRHGKAAVYWQIGDSGSGAAQAFYRDLLRGIADADPEITSLYEMPGLAAQQYYDRDNLAADLGLARDDPALAAAAEAYLAAAREEFWLEAARLARLRLRSGPDHRRSDASDAGLLTSELRAGTAVAEDEDEDGAEAESTGMPEDITDPATGLSRLLSGRCTTCILRPGDKMHLGPEQTAAFVRRVLAEGTYVVCHQTLTYGDNPDFGPADLPGLFRCLRRPLAGTAPAARLRPPDRGRPAPAGRARRRRGPVTAEAVEQLRTLCTVAVRDLAPRGHPPLRRLADLHARQRACLVRDRRGGRGRAARRRAPRRHAGRTQLTKPRWQKGWSRACGGTGSPPDTGQPLAGPGTTGSAAALAPGGAACRVPRTLVLAVPHAWPGNPAQLEVSHAARPGRSACQRHGHAR